MSDSPPNIYVLDAAYKPFPSFSEWSDRVGVESARWDRYRNSLQSSSSLSPENLERAKNIAKRAAAFDTGAIEGLYQSDRGLTYTIAFETAAWEAALSREGEQVRSLFEAQMEAYDYVLDLATKAEPISEAAIRTIHEVVCRAQDTYSVITAIGPQQHPLPKGEYKAHPNHVRTRKATDHSYAPVDVTPSEMQRLATELRSEPFANAHPAIQAAYAHYGLVVIHPFADGNGRVARALASVFAYRAISMPIVILSEQKEVYLNALEESDAGVFQSFVTFILDRFLDTMNLVEDSIKAAMTPNPTSELASIDRLYLTKGGYKDEEVDEFGKTLLSMISHELGRVFGERDGRKVTLQTEIKFAPLPGARPARPATPVTRPRGTAPPPRAPVPETPPVPNVPPSHREPLSRRTTLSVVVQSEAPAVSSVTRNFILFVPKDAASDDDLKLITPQGEDLFSARVDQVQSRNSEFLNIRLTMFAERILGGALAKLREVVANAMRTRRS
jgi:Fic family protein